MLQAVLSGQAESLLCVWALSVFTSWSVLLTLSFVEVWFEAFRSPLFAVKIAELVGRTLSVLVGEITDVWEVNLRPQFITKTINAIPKWQLSDILSCFQQIVRGLGSILLSHYIRRVVIGYKSSAWFESPGTWSLSHFPRWWVKPLSFLSKTACCLYRGFYLFCYWTYVKIYFFFRQGQWS